MNKFIEINNQHKNITYSPYNVTFGMGGGLLQKVNRDSMRFATKLNSLYLVKKSLDNNSYEIIERNVMKDPKTDPGKRSLPGELAVAVVKLIDGNDGNDKAEILTDLSHFQVPLLQKSEKEELELEKKRLQELKQNRYAIKVFNKKEFDKQIHNKKLREELNLLKVVYDCGPLKYNKRGFDELRKQVERQWLSYENTKSMSAIKSDKIIALQKSIKTKQDKVIQSGLSKSKCDKIFSQFK
jgi:nicotinic acid phosphoribosyltransferase